MTRSSRHAALDRPLAAVALPVQLTGRVRVGVDGELAAQLDGQAAAAAAAGRAARGGS